LRERQSALFPRPILPVLRIIIIEFQLPKEKHDAAMEEGTEVSDSESECGRERTFKNRLLRTLTKLLHGLFSGTGLFCIVIYKILRVTQVLVNCSSSFVRSSSIGTACVRSSSHNFPISESNTIFRTVPCSHTPSHCTQLTNDEHYSTSSCSHREHGELRALNKPGPY
jgi:hypothetical protein